MRIIFVITHLTTLGGAGKFLMDYANEFCEKGHDITIVTQKIEWCNYRFNKKISIIEIGGSLPSSFLYWLNFSNIKKKYLKVLNKLDGDLIISFFFPINYICSIIRNKKNLKHVYYCFEPYRLFHDKNYYGSAPFLLRTFSWFLRFFFKRLDIKGTFKADEIICISKFIKEKVKKIYGKNGYLHYIGVNVRDDFNELNHFKFKHILRLKKDIPVIFTLGLSHHMKGAKELIHIFQYILREIPETILIIGGWIRKENKIIIKKLIKKLRIPKNSIFFSGLIDMNYLKYFYTIATITFYTAIDESFGLIPLESMLNGTPVIAFEGGPSETILDNKTGYLIENNSIEQFAQKAIKLIKDKELYRKFSEKAKDHVKKNFSYEKGISDLEMILNKIISKN